MFHSLRWRIAIPFIVLIILALISMGIYLSDFAKKSYVDSLTTNTINEGNLLRESLISILSSQQDYYHLDAKAKSWSRLLDKRVTLIGIDGTVLGESHEDLNQMDNHLNRPEIQDALMTGIGVSSRFSHTLEQKMLYVALKVEDNLNQYGFIRLALPLNTIADNVRHIQNTLLVVVIIAILLAAVLAMWMSRRIIKPIHDLTIFASDVSQNIPGSTQSQFQGSEIETLTNSINLLTLQLQAQIDELEVERGRMAAVLSEMSDGVIIIDSQGEVQLINPAIEKMFLVKQEQVIGRSLIEVFRHHQINELWRETHNSGETHLETLEIKSPHLHLNIVSTSLGAALPGSTLLLFQDVTQLRQLETIRQDFISNISHELRTPLASLKALAETLQEGALEDPPAAKRFLKRMESEVDSLGLMVSELLELARIESGKVPLHFSITHPCVLISQAVDRLKLQADRAGLTIFVSCSENLPNVQVDAKRLEQVLVNLLHNAIKFTPEGGMIRTSAELRLNRIQFIIEDNGIGIPSEDLMRIFERFYKSDRSRSSTGTGLGLAISRHLVEAHGGEIWVESTLGSGSIFSFSIPLTENWKKKIST